MARSIPEPPPPVLPAATGRPQGLAAGARTRRAGAPPIGLQVLVSIGIMDYHAAMDGGCRR